MGSFVDIDGDPNEIRGTGAVIRAMAETFGADIRPLAGEISGIRSARPWGSDKFGQEFDKEFNKPPVKNGVPTCEMVQASLAEAGESAQRTGGRVIEAMDGYQAADDQGETDISSVRR